MLRHRDDPVAQDVVLREDPAEVVGPQGWPLGEAVEPRVAIPDSGKNVELGGLGSSVVHRHRHEDVLGVGLGILDLDVEVPVLTEDARIDELVLLLGLRPRSVRRHQIVVRVGGVRVLVEVPHIGVGRCVVDVEVVLLHVLAVVALGVGETEHPLLDDRVFAVPQGECHAQLLTVVADPRPCRPHPTGRPASGPDRG